jgi:hypothetical protein
LGARRGVDRAKFKLKKLAKFGEILSIISNKFVFRHPNKKSLHGGLRTDHPQASMRGIVDSSKIERVFEIIDNLDYCQDF